MTRSIFYGLCPLVKLLLGRSWIENGGFFLNVALFMRPQYPEQNQSTAMANNDKAFMWSVTGMNLVSRCSYFRTQLQCWSVNFWEWKGWRGDQNMCHVLFTTDMCKQEPTFNCFYAHLAEKIVTAVHTSGSRLIWQMEERA